VIFMRITAMEKKLNISCSNTFIKVIRLSNINKLNHNR
jgi:hypothetical protein